MRIKYHSFGEWIKANRIQDGVYNKKEFAKKLGTSAMFVTLLEQGRVAYPKSKLRTLAKLFGFSVKYVIGELLSYEFVDQTKALNKLYRVRK